MSTLRVSNIEAKADPSSPSVDEKLKVTNSNGDVLVHIDGKTAGITTVGINTTDSSFTVDAAQNVEFLGIVTATKFSLSGGGEITGGDGNFTGIVTATSISATDSTIGVATITSLTASAANFTGNVSIAGTLTYEDVTNVDSIGIATARTGIDVTGGHIDLVDNSKIRVGTGTDLQIYHDASHSYIEETGTGALKLKGSDVRIENTSSRNVFKAVGTACELFFDNGSTSSKKFETTNTGAVVTGSLTATTFSGNLTGNVTGNITGNITGESTLPGISSSISDTATDIFVYDTSKDSDGGAWRKRTRNTSWYNEAASSTRGSRKEFPAVAVIVAEATKVTIYDGDDPDLSMWMVFNQTGGSDGQNRMLNRHMGNLKSVSMLNGNLTIFGNSTSSADRGGGVWINFISEFGYAFGTDDSQGENIYGTLLHNIAQRNTILGTDLYGDKVQRYQLADNSQCNDVEMTVLPNAPIDSSTGLPIPTIVVGTEGGFSIIKDNGTVISGATGSNSLKTLSISDDNVIYFGNHTQGGYYPYDLNTGLYINNARFFGSAIDGPVTLLKNISTSTNKNVLFTGDDGQSLAIGMDNGLNLISGDPRNGIVDNGMIAYVASDYNTGWMHGDVKGAFMSDTDTTNAVVAYSDGFSNNDKGWAFADNGSSTISGGNLILEQNGNARAYDVDALDGIATGTKLVFTGTVGGSGTGTFIIDDDGAGAGVGGVTNYGSVTSTGSFIFTATKTASNRIRFFRTTGSNNYEIAFLNITTEYDRSVNDKGLSVYGTITKSAVATGADLVAYSGFSASNYLKQQYNSDLAPGTGAYSVSCWFKTGTSSGDQYIFDRNGGGSNNSRNLLLIMSSGASGSSANKFQWWHRDGSGNVSDIHVTDKVVTDNIWHQVVAVNDGSTYKVYVDGEVSSVTNSVIRNVGNDNSPPMFIGIRHSEGSTFITGSMALFRYSKSAPSPEQIKKMYEDEKHLFQENAKATLYGSSDEVTALAFDDDNNLLHVGTSAGRSDFQGLRRINNTTTAVTTAISASDDLIAEQ